MRARAMQCMLQQSSLHSLLMLTSQALARRGFGDVQILDRRETRQKSRLGGHELICQFALGPLPMKAIVKVINDAVRLRMLDEMAGAVLRTRADLGLIVSPHHITASAARFQGRYGSARVEVVAGEALADILMELGIGMRGRQEIDYQFFESLEEYGALSAEFLRKVDA
jgi:hypothetical protein